MAAMMAADDEDNKVDGDSATGDGATARWDSTMTMMATGKEVDNDGDGATGDDDDGR